MQCKEVNSPRDIASSPSSATALRKLDNETANQIPNGTTQHSNKPPLKHEAVSRTTCQICKDRPIVPKGRLDNEWVECEINSCMSWFHVSCLLTCNTRKHMLFSPSNQPKDSLFICHNCFEHRKEKDTDEISQAVTRFLQVLGDMGLPTRIESTGTELQPVSINHELDALRTDDHQETNDRLQGGNAQEGSSLNFEPAKQERYQSADQSLVKNLIQKIHEAIYNYDIEVREANERFGEKDNPVFQRPLPLWEFVDHGKNLEEGHPWFVDFDPRPTGKIYSMCHAPITAALRSMLQTSPNSPLNTDPSLNDLTFSQVHIGLITWFVFDILNNEIDLYELSNMEPIRAMRAAVYDAGEARWEAGGHHLLREIQLRTWEKTENQKQLPQIEKVFNRKLGDFLYPLTKEFGQHSHYRLDIIEHSIRLWSYLRPLEGKLTMIKSNKVGDLFDSREADGFEGTVTEKHLPRDSQTVVRWVLSRGFKYEERNVYRSQGFLVKGRVVI
ncbi:hypothetical protein G7Y89_g6639 [Cudoniella acicularis]|uniref:PHD-type domain-containing protein n=1 Tax=Cudoniella acicularis TaxID=354080 RepID=A0A8H4RMD3_9HELO|nr:hypothetical protein G7Y89_g6639 [Cudoniella acicularis]